MELKRGWLVMETVLGPPVLEEAFQVVCRDHVGPIWAIIKAAQEAGCVFDSWGKVTTNRRFQLRPRQRTAGHYKGFAYGSLKEHGL